MNVFKDASKEELEAEITKLEAERQDLFKQKEPIDALLVKKYKEIERLQEIKAKIKLAEPMTDDEKLAYFLEADDTSNAKYNAAQEYFRALDVMSSGYRRDTMQRAITITLTKGSEESFIKTKAAVEYILPALKADEDGNRRFDILEHTCSAGGTSYDLVIHADGTATVSSGRWNTNKPTTLDKALRYIQENVWYESVSEEDKDSDDDDY